MSAHACVCFESCRQTSVSAVVQLSGAYWEGLSQGAVLPRRPRREVSRTRVPQRPLPPAHVSGREAQLAVRMAAMLDDNSDCKAEDRFGLERRTLNPPDRPVTRYIN